MYNLGVILEPKIIAESSGFLILDKPAGLIVHSDGRTDEPSLADWLIEHYPQLSGVGEPWVSPQGEVVAMNGIVHRLDRTTSGVMIVAKTPAMYVYLKNEFKERRIDKRYRAYVYGHMESDQGKIIADIVRSVEPPKRWYARPCQENDNRAAITEWSVLKRLKSEAPISYIQAEPLTGRTHQIRVHMASIGHPIISDHLYAPEHLLLLDFKRPALHARRIAFSLPSGEYETFVATHPDFP